MMLINLIAQLKTIREAENLISSEIPDVEFGLIDVYVRGVLAADSEIKLFDAETIPNQLVIEVDGVGYVNLFPLPMLQEMVEEYSKSEINLTNDEILKRILDYRNKDA